ncbi:phage tail-collar fiber domain-containing protein [Dickeya oryzae]
MAVKYMTLLTQVGAAKLANATALGKMLNITHMGVGDGGGNPTTPYPTQTALINEKRRAVLNALRVDPNSPNQIIAEQIIPENEGGFWLREIGLYDADGDLIAVANCPDTYKPQLQEGSGRVQTVRMILVVSNTSAVTLKVDPSVVLATRQSVDDKAIEVKAYADDLMAKHLANANPHKQYAPLASPALTGTPTTPSVALDLSTTQIANTAYVSAMRGPFRGVTGVPANSTLTLTVDYTDKVIMARGGAAITIPASATIVEKRAFTIVAVDSTPVTIALTSGDSATPTINGLTFPLTLQQGEQITLVSRGTSNAYIVVSYISKTLNSPALTGTPTAPTAAAGTNNTQLATTAFVKNNAVWVYGDLAGLDLNTLTGSRAGRFWQKLNAGATEALHYPVQLAGSLDVEKKRGQRRGRVYSALHNVRRWFSSTCIYPYIQCGDTDVGFVAGTGLIIQPNLHRRANGPNRSIGHEYHAVGHHRVCQKQCGVGIWDFS